MGERIPSMFARLRRARDGDRPPIRGGPEKGVPMSQNEPVLATIVVCESDEATLHLLCDHLTADRYEVLPASSAADALRFCRYNRPDLMLLDMAPSGLEVIRDIRETDGVEAHYDPNLPIIVLAGRADKSERGRGLDIGADDYVQKAFSYEELRTPPRGPDEDRPPEATELSKASDQLQVAL